MVIQSKSNHLLYQGRKENIHDALFQYHNMQSLQQLGQILALKFNCANPNCILYKLFEEQHITEGIIKWRLHEQSRDVCIMNDIKRTTGHLMPQSFVHIECTKGANDEDIFL